MQLVQERRLTLVGSTLRPRPMWEVIFATGFRPFFLLSSLFAAGSVPVWLLMYLGGSTWSSPYPAMVWHAHEMLFGFTFAVVAGFLLTAVQNWTGRRVASPVGIAMLAAWWVAGRVAMLASARMPVLALAVIDSSFLFALGAVVARPIIQTGNRRNLIVVALLCVAGAANVAVHTALWNGDVVAARTILFATLDVVLVLIAVIAGRVIPFFTRSALPHFELRQPDARDTIAVVSLVLLFSAHCTSWLTGEHPTARLVVGVVCQAAGVANLARMVGWSPLASLRIPLLAVLHVGYGMLGAGLLLVGWATLWQPAATTAATHLLTLGCVGLLCIGMMSRVALGHTGRPLRASMLMTTSFSLVAVGAIARAVLPILWPETYRLGLMAGASLWSVAYGLFFVVYLPILTRPRSDGRPG
jgi:uncharacterized protein involved in response to NO